MKEKICSTLLSLTLLALPAMAQNSGTPASAPATPEIDYDADKTLAPPELRKGPTLEVVRGSSVLLNLPDAIDRLALANDKIATTKVLTKQEVLIQGIELGQTSLLAWLANGERIAYQIHTLRDLSTIRMAIKDMAPEAILSESPDGKTVIMRGKVPTLDIASSTQARVERLLRASEKNPPMVLSLLELPDGTSEYSLDMKLSSALKGIDERIRIRRMENMDDAEGKTAYVLEGKVQSLPQLVRAITLADLQLGGDGGVITAPQDTKLNVSSGNFGRGQGGSNNQGQRKNGLASHLAKDLVLKTSSGRVFSFIKVDELHQVLVSIRALEIDRNKARTTGINYAISGTDFSLGLSNNPGGSSGGGNFSGANIGSAVGLAGNVVGSYVGSTETILAAINFMQGKSVARTVAEPNVLTLTGEQATVQVGGEIPLPSTTLNDVAAVQSVDFQSFGVKMDIRPTVDEDYTITLEAAPSISRPDFGVSSDGVPGFKTQSVQTTARVKNGESLVIGGLINYEEVEEERKVPILGDIPILSFFFKWTRKIREERELIFVITPTIIDYDNYASQGSFDPPSLKHRDHFRMMEELDPSALGHHGLPITWTSPDYKHTNQVSEAEQKTPSEEQITDANPKSNKSKK